MKEYIVILMILGLALSASKAYTEELTCALPSRNVNFTESVRDVYADTICTP